MEIRVAVAKINKYAVSESGDTLEMVERPHGGLSFVLVDGQRSGKSAKNISNVVARKAIQLLAEGVRDGAAARAAQDYLYTYRGGKVSATLNILSLDMDSKTIVISRNNEAPVIVHTQEEGLIVLDEPSQSVGVRKNVKPVITEIPLALGTVVIAFTDGLRHAGTLSGQERYDPIAAANQFFTQGIFDPRRLADTLLSQAVAQDLGRPRDDISILVISVLPGQDDPVRRLDVSLPL
ncbi:MAG: SpoIIE family protein phosphatase [Anaerolineae bacterium]|nr:SpoIIE family protein phosphatase [Anaerolineae bacterium]